MPVFHEGTIYTSRGYRSGPYMAIRPGGKGDVSKSHVRWRVDTGAPYVSSLVHYNGLLYMAGDVGVLSASEASTGQRVERGWPDDRPGRWTQAARARAQSPERAAARFARNFGRPHLHPHR
jgi:hypothetical protein